MAVGQVDVLVGLPTLNNAATVADIVRAVHVCFTRDFPRLRTVMINSDGGSTDGTPELIRDATFSEADMVQTSHSLRTLHRVVAPYHGLPGKHTALRTVFAAAELTQAKALVVLDPGRPGDDARARHRADHADHARRRRVPGAALSAASARRAARHAAGPPAGARALRRRRSTSRSAPSSRARDASRRIASSGTSGITRWRGSRSISGCAPRRWPTDSPSVRSGGRSTAAAGARATLREAVQQVVLALVESLRAHESFWLAPARRRGAAHVGQPTRRRRPTPPTWDYEALAEQARQDIGEIRPLLDGVLDADLVARLVDDVSAPAFRLDDELWVRIVYAFAAATRRGTTGIEHLAGMFVPLYLWRAAAFMAQTSHEADAAVQARLDSLCQTFQRLKPVLVDSWSAAA